MQSSLPRAVQYYSVVGRSVRHVCECLLHIASVANEWYLNGIMTIPALGCSVTFYVHAVSSEGIVVQPLRRCPTYEITYGLFIYSFMKRLTDIQQQKSSSIFARGAKSIKMSIAPITIHCSFPAAATHSTPCT